MQKVHCWGEVLLLSTSSWPTPSFGSSFTTSQKEMNGCLAGLCLSVTSEDLMELLG